MPGKPQLCYAISFQYKFGTGIRREEEMRYQWITDESGLSSAEEIACFKDDCLAVCNEDISGNIDDQKGQKQ